jgi:hypothetical protein
MYFTIAIFHLLSPALGQTVYSADNIRISTKDSLMGRFNLFITEFDFLTTQESRMLVQVANVYLDIVPNRFSYSQNLHLLDPSLSLGERMNILRSNPNIANLFFSKLSKKNIGLNEIQPILLKITAYRFCTEIIKGSVSMEESKIICLCVKDNAPEIPLNDDDAYFNALFMEIKSCYNRL